jgi:hypothetical protein
MVKQKKQEMVRHLIVTWLINSCLKEMSGWGNSEKYGHYDEDESH